MGLPSSQNEEILISNSGCFSYDNFHLQVKLPMKIVLGDILFCKINRQGGGIRILKSLITSEQGKAVRH